MTKTIWFIGMAIMLFACQVKTDAASSGENLPVDVPVYGYYHSQPRTPFEEQENAIIDFLAANYPTAVQLDSGIYLMVFDTGAGDTLQWGDLIRIHYRVSSLQGEIFYSSDRQGKPLITYVGNGVDGWNVALQRLQVGSHALFAMTSSRGYCEAGFGNTIPPNTPLVFEVTVEAILDPDDQ